MNIHQMQGRLKKFYPDAKVEITDLTGTEDHWEVYVESAFFNGMSRVQQHQHVMKCFSDELKTEEVHALSIKTKVKEG